MTDFNMPPGVSVNDIPGNRPEDLAADEFWEKLGESCPDVPDELFDDEVVQKLVESARDLAYSAGYAAGRADQRSVERAVWQSESVDPQPQDERWRQLLIIAKTQTINDSPEAFVQRVIVMATAALAEARRV